MNSPRMIQVLTFGLRNTLKRFNARPMATLAQLESLKKALSYDRPPLCSGAISPSPEGLYLYYGKKNPRFIDFASATPADLDLLTAACDPATFGRGNEDVYDESYRKAVKMDASNFSVQLDLAGSGLIRTIEDQLLQGEAEKMRIRAELYKLNVHDKGSFFKTHRDTPRGTDMLGSLVITYPTPHEGGELALRHKDREWKFDANSLTVTQPSPSLAYVAFYSDIEHEVLEVTSGRRVTITYNLYFVDPASRPGVSAITPNLKNTSNLQTTLRGLLKNPEFLPDGGTLGFGLAHLYPVTFETELREMATYLKGEDAHVYRACRELQLQPSLQVIYSEADSFRDECGVMLDQIVRDPDYECEDGDSYESTLIRELGGVLVNKTQDTVLKRPHWVSDGEGEEVFITWISPFNEQNQLEDISMTYGNEFCAGFIYCSPCIIVRIPAASDRV
ncbi:hypothetical protein BDM02DRAFT_3167372 [Thelephora ganbajun]|uniref:Uncharacterized protein n=1 Tax=Thelephora ganbajun TaxID=370292 RepID=A0ACB6ZHR3_THEGA|nr:hypothetical protein BDM02DRAFT_3167372 [Thelephora ganbajun]